MSLLRRVFLVAVAAVVASTCGGGGGDGMGPPTLTSVTVTGDSTVVLNGTRVLTAQAMAGATAVSTGVTYTWSANNALVNIAPNGAMATITGLTRGLVTITVQASTSAQPSGPSDTHALRVRIGSIVVTPTLPTMTSIDDTVRLTAEARDATNAAVPGVSFTWQSLNAAVVTVTPVNTTQADVVAEGNGSTQITVTGDAVPLNLGAAVSQVATTLNIVQPDTTVDRISAQFTPTVQATDARGNPVTGAGITWQSRNTGVANVNLSGLIMSVNEGSTYVVATSGALKDSVQFNVVLVYGSVNIVADTTIRRLNGTRQLAAQVRDVGNTVVPGPQLTWSFKTGGIATVDPTGLVTGGPSTGADSVIATARTVADTALFRIIQVTATVAVTPATAGENLNFVGDTLQFAATAEDSGGAPVPGETFTWSSTNTGVFDVDQAGVVSAVGNGSARVRAVAGAGRDSVVVTVARVPVSAALSPGSFPTITALNDSTLASCVVEDSSAAVIANHPCNWFALTGGVVAIRPNPADTVYIVALANGSTTIEAEAAVGVPRGQNFVQVQQEAALIKLHPQTIDASTILATTGTVQFVDTAFDANGFLVSPAPTVTWSSSDGARASVNASGLATAGATTGNVYIRAGSGAALDSSLVIVTNTPVTLSGDVQPIFTTSCASAFCHGGAVPQQGQNLSSGQTFFNIVNVVANQSVLARAEPGQPDFSYLVHKVQGTHLVPPANGTGFRMPEGCTTNCLNRDQINRIRNWILQGALNN